MILGRITLAVKTLVKLGKREGVSFPVASRLFMLKKKLMPYYEMQAEQENVILEASGAVNENGEIDMTNIRSAFAKLQCSQVDYDEPPIQIELTADDYEKLGLTGEIMDILDGFVEFMEVGV